NRLEHAQLEPGSARKSTRGWKPAPARGNCRSASERLRTLAADIGRGLYRRTSHPSRSDRTSHNTIVANLIHAFASEGKVIADPAPLSLTLFSLASARLRVTFTL